ncbi:hypothetical protein [Spiroplasma diminutum]|uniref:Uncharacterized protein n=1 Tax=Spiroplasma diminutum CUAS-1 TaxID=1276221 RepID=S5LZU0_9MOLU|nr:hypothetical protein [Spiroplasma diminutum]AGR42126.1 hypothetical protein SDIMI_v3c04220 [Spiroplasma diminutum CUAS-1]
MFEKYIKMNKQELQKSLAKIEKDYKDLLNQEKQIDKKVRKNLWLWYFFPLFGLIIYQVHLKKRKENDSNFYTIKEKKKDLIYIELEIQFLKSKIENTEY